MAPTPGSGKRPQQQSIAAMDECTAEFIKRLIIRMSFGESMPMLRTWGLLTERDLQSLTIKNSKDGLAMEVVHLCENRKATMDHAADLDLVYNHGKSNLKKWSVYEMSEQSDSEMSLASISNFQTHFKKAVFSVQKNVTIHFREFGDALWIRIAWGKDYVKPNQYRPTFIVYHSQTPYVFVASLNKTQKPVVDQGLFLATGYSNIRMMDLKSQCLESLKDIVFKRFSQPFQSYRPRSVPEESCTPTTAVDENVDYEKTKEKERVRHVMLKTFGDGPLPKLEFAEYKMETAFTGNSDIANKIEPFRCAVTFSSPHLLESIRSLAHSGLSHAPVSRLFSSIPHSGRNLFKVTEKQSSSSHTAN